MFQDRSKIDKCFNILEKFHNNLKTKFKMLFRN
jgi:hypothetical protein